MKSDLEAQNLWSIIESTYDPPRQDDDEVLFTNWGDKNFKALRVIRNSCGLRAFSKIKGIDSAKIAWDTLLEKYGKPKDNSIGIYPSFSYSLSSVHMLNNFIYLLQMTLLTSAKIII